MGMEKSFEKSRPSGERPSEIDAIVFQGKRMRDRAKEMLQGGVLDASWENLEGEDSGLNIYIVPLADIDEEYLSGFEKLFNHIKDETGEYGIFLGVRNAETER